MENLKGSQQTISLEIVGLSNQGDGFGFLEGKKIFVPLTLPKEKVQVRKVFENSKFFRGEIASIERVLKDRVQPICPYFSQCGGCSLQHFPLPLYRKFKLDLLKTTLSRCLNGGGKTAGLLEVKPGDRRRITLKVHRDDQGNHQIGLYQKGSRQLVEINHCPLITTPLNHLFPLLNSMAADLFPHRGGEIFMAELPGGIELIFHGEIPPEHQLKKVGDILSKNSSLFRAFWKTEKGLTLLFKKSTPQPLFDFPPGGFHQPSQKGETFLKKIVAHYLKGSEKILDLFCGSGTHSIHFIQRGIPVHGIEISTESIAKFKENGEKSGGTPFLTVEARDLYKFPLSEKELRGFSVAIINPPRGGCGKKLLQPFNHSDIKTIVLISCNPVTLESDLKILLEKFTLRKAIPLDQFPFSPFLESILILQRKFEDTLSQG